MEKRKRQVKETANQILQADKPYEKFLQYGAESLTDGELLAIILRTGTQEASALELANQVLALTKYPRCGLLGLYDLTLEELMQVKGIGQVKAVKLKSLTELSMRFSRSCAKKGLNVRQPATIAGYFMEKLRHLPRECVYLVCLDGKGQMIAERRLSDGSVNMALITPREIFMEALRTQAVNIILIHNHPSGDPSPSGPDRELTGIVYRMGNELGIPLLDHIIIGDNVFYSFRNDNRLEDA